MKDNDKDELLGCRSITSPYRGASNRDKEHAMVECIKVLGLDWLEAGEFCIEHAGANRNAMNHWVNTYNETEGLRYY